MSGFHGGWTGGRALPPDVGWIGGVGTSPDGGVAKLHKTRGGVSLGLGYPASGGHGPGVSMVMAGVGSSGEDGGRAVPVTT